VLNLKKYDPGIHPILFYWMAKSGLILEQIAKEIGVSAPTIDRWVAAHPELRDAMKPAKDFVDNLVEGSLLKRALGYDYDEVTRERVAVKFEVQGGQVVPVKWAMSVTKRVRKHFPGDVGAQAFWLKNRCGWRDKIDIAATVEHRQNFDALSDDELRMARALAAKLEAGVAGRN
jgi:hypothetical protein